MGSTNRREDKIKSWVDFVGRWTLATGERTRRFVCMPLRLAEACLPIPILVVLLLPAAALMATYELLMWKNSTFSQLRRLSETARLSGVQQRRSLRQVWTGRVAMCMARFLRFWPDKLREPRWSHRCQFMGVERLEALLSQGRPVVLVTLHYGNLTELYHWIRSRGIGVAFLTDAVVPAYQNQFDLLADRANGLEGVPRHLGTGHLHLWQARDFLAQPNRILVVVIEGYPTRRDIMVGGPGCWLRVAPGALHLAAIAGAVVIPCLFSAEKYLRSTIRFSEPLADDLVVRRDRHPSGCQQILRQLGPWIGAEPEQSDPTLLHAFRFQENPGFGDEPVKDTDK